MSMYLRTLCGRYGKVREEQFLRRYTTREPVDTPRRYYNSDESYYRGAAACNSAWAVWKQANYPYIPVEKTPWFELIDEELLEICHLVNSKHNNNVQEGIRLLEARIMRATLAKSMIQIDNENWAASREQREDWWNTVRQSPSLLVTIWNDLTIDPLGEQAKTKLRRLCDCESVSGAMLAS